MSSVVLGNKTVSPTTDITHVWVFRWPIKTLALGMKNKPRRFLGSERTRMPTHRECWEVMQVLPGGAWLRRSNDPSRDVRQRLFSLKSGVCMDMPDLVLSLAAKRDLRRERRLKWGRKNGETPFKGEHEHLKVARAKPLSSSR